MENINIEPINSVKNRVNLYHSENIEKPRQHFGGSMAGHYCERYLWLNFRWAVITKLPGRIKRLFRRGHNEEFTVFEDLKNAGYEVTDSQKRVNFAPHFSGSIDGIITGLFESPKKKHLLEIKTHSLKSFDDLEKNGVEKSKFQHYVQMQLYMHALNIDRALYYAICKNDDRIYTERIKYDIEVALKYIERGKNIINNARCPDRISNDASWYQCKMCDFHSFCHVTKKTREVNCRTCCHSTFNENGLLCEKFDNVVPELWQLEGCSSHVVHPDLVPYILNEKKSTQYDACYVIENGEEILNGENGKSSEWLLLDEKMRLLYDEFNGEVVKK